MNPKQNEITLTEDHLYYLTGRLLAIEYLLADLLKSTEESESPEFRQVFGDHVRRCFEQQETSLPRPLNEELTVEKGISDAYDRIGHLIGYYNTSRTVISKGGTL
ncbi:MAG: hypothetical protein OXO51_02555 [Gemmatimonadota bacterium]|nr:hypothetical protein [Gemmatimonadota bacterium]